MRSWEVAAVVVEEVLEEAEGGEVKFGGVDAETDAEEKTTERLILVAPLCWSRASEGRTVICLVLYIIFEKSRCRKHFILWSVVKKNM